MFSSRLSVCWLQYGHMTVFPQRFGFTLCCPDDIPVPSGALDLYRSSDYWILSASTVHHNGQERKVDFNLEQLRVGQTIGCVVNREGQLRYIVDGKEPGYVGWTDLPTDRPLWGFADIYGLARKIKSEFLCGEYSREGGRGGGGRVAPYIVHRMCISGVGIL